MYVYTAQKNEVSMKGFFSKCEHIQKFLRIWSYLVKNIINEKLHFLCSGIHTRSAKVTFLSIYIFLLKFRHFGFDIFSSKMCNQEATIQIVFRGFCKTSWIIPHDYIWKSLTVLSLITIHIDLWINIQCLTSCMKNISNYILYVFLNPAIKKLLGKCITSFTLTIHILEISLQIIYNIWLPQERRSKQIWKICKECYIWTSVKFLMF